MTEQPRPPSPSPEPEQEPLAVSSTDYVVPIVEGEPDREHYPDVGSEVEPLSEPKPTHCYSCYAKAKLTCGGSKGIRYCSRWCQKIDWSRHKLLCLPKQPEAEPRTAA